MVCVYIYTYILYIFTETCLDSDIYIYIYIYFTFSLPGELPPYGHDSSVVKPDMQINAHRTHSLHVFAQVQWSKHV